MAIQHFKDDATAFNNKKQATVEGKGVLNNRISEHILNNLNQVGIKTHLIKRLNMREQLIKKAEKRLSSFSSVDPARQKNEKINRTKSCTSCN